MMSDKDQPSKAAQQEQNSRQSAQQGQSTKNSVPSESELQQTKGGIGSSQSQDLEEPREQQDSRPSAGTPDVERGSAEDIDRETSSRDSRDSLVQDSTGAFKERP